MSICQWLKPVVLIGVFAVGLTMVMPTSARCTDTWYHDQRQYAHVLNPLAASVMSWYGYLVDVESDRERFPETREQVQTLFASDEALSTAEKLYPDRIRTIDILDAGLKRRQPQQFAFRLAIRIVYGVADQLREATITENVVFAVAPSQPPKILSFERIKTPEGSQSSLSEGPPRGDRLHYQLRQFAYAWLAEMDRSPHHARFMPDAMNQAIYDVEFGAMTFRGDVETTLRKRRAKQGLGGHLLRSLTVVQPPGKIRPLTIELIMDWKGKTPDGLKAIGKIRQEIRFVISDNGQLTVMHIREQHLLPDLEPWTKLLC